MVGVEEEEPRIAEAAAVRRAHVVGDTGREGAGETGNILPAEGEEAGRTALAGLEDIAHEEEGTGPAEEDIDPVEEGDTGHSPEEAAVLRCVRLVIMGLDQQRIARRRHRTRLRGQGQLVCEKKEKEKKIHWGGYLRP